MSVFQKSKFTASTVVFFFHYLLSSDFILCGLELGKLCLLMINGMSLPFVLYLHHIQVCELCNPGTSRNLCSEL